jgi:hypothetical protein
MHWEIEQQYIHQTETRTSMPISAVGITELPPALYIRKGWAEQGLGTL